MPIYEYECQQCENITEARQNLSEEPLTTCPDCQGELRKLISSSSFQLKGGGWYADGYSTSPTKTKKDTKPAECKKKASCPCASSAN